MSPNPDYPAIPMPSIRRGRPPYCDGHDRLIIRVQARAIFCPDCELRASVPATWMLPPVGNGKRTARSIHGSRFRLIEFSAH